MIRSMTGFGGASDQVDGAHFALEVRSLNNRYFKVQVRLPEELQGLEAQLEAALAKRLSRGSAVITVRFADCSADAAARINTSAVQRYLEQMLALREAGHEAVRVDLGMLLSLPGVVIADTGEERVEHARNVLLRLLEEACGKLIAMRESEGRLIHEELHRHCRVIADHLQVVTKRVPQMIEMYQERLRQRMEALLAASGASVREEDLLREVAVFAERSDIAEEVARLGGHLAQFREIIDADGEEPSGRTLDFIAQEMLREANTIASKCLDVEVSRRIVEIKGAIDRIKEQVQNVE
jgi:uncharacterized protein (TIGR00255 family)